MGLGLSCFGKPGSCFGESSASKQRNQNAEKQKQKLEMDKECSRCSTLEEWLVASPGMNKGCPSNGGEFVVFRQSSSKKVHPSISVSEIAEALAGPRDSPSKEKLLLKVEDESVANGGDESEAQLCRSLSGKSKKRVSFRLPEESDIFIFYSPPEI